MAADETTSEGGGGVLAGLLAPLRLPERVIDALDSLVEATRELSPIRTELAHVRKQTEPLGELLPALERLEERIERVREQTEPLGELLPALEHVEEALGTRIESLHELLGALEGPDSYLNKTVAELHGEVSAMHKTLHGLQDDVQSVTDRLPDANRGPLQKAHDVLTRGDANPSS